MLGVVRSDALPEVARTALSDGLDSPSLRGLAGLTATDPEARPLFERVLAELSLPLPTPSEAVMVLARSVAAKILDGTTAPYDGAKQIWELSLRLEEPPPQLHTFIYGASEWQERPEDQKLFADGIIAAAQDLVQSTPTQ